MASGALGVRSALLVPLAVLRHAIRSRSGVVDPLQNVTAVEVRRIIQPAQGLGASASRVGRRGEHHQQRYGDEDDGGEAARRARCPVLLEPVARRRLVLGRPAPAVRPPSVKSRSAVPGLARAARCGGPVRGGGMGRGGLLGRGPCWPGCRGRPRWMRSGRAGHSHLLGGGLERRLPGRRSGPAPLRGRPLPEEHGVRGPVSTKSSGEYLSERR